MADTADRLLDAAHGLVAQRGFNAFSYRDLAALLGIKTASIHYHFPRKADLGRALVARYQMRLTSSLVDLDRTVHNPVDRLRAFIGHYGDGVRESHFCLCGMLASDAATLTDDVRTQIQTFFESVERWLAVVLTEGRDDGSFAFPGDSSDQAVGVLAAVEGALLTAWPYHADQGTRRYQTATDALLARLVSP